MTLVLNAFKYCMGWETSQTMSSAYEQDKNMVLSEISHPYREMSRALRADFMGTAFEERRAIPGHTHGASAATRSAASTFADTLGYVTGRTPVFIQMSATDQRRGRAGTRSYYWSKDLNAEARDWEFTDNDILVFIDVDYYMDDIMAFISQFKLPALIYTFQPGRAGKATGEYKYCFDKNSMVTYSVSGGGEYRHKVWNYRGDAVAYTEKFCGLTCFHVPYALERKKCDDDHDLILLAPLGFFSGPLEAWRAKNMLKAEELKRLDLRDGSFIRLNVDTQDGSYVSTAFIGGHLSSKTTKEIDERILLMEATSTNVTHAQVVGKMTSEGDGSEGSEVLLAYLKEKRGKLGNVTGLMQEKVYKTDFVKNFEYLPKVMPVEEQKPSMQSFMNPILDGAFAPVRSKNNEERMVQERVLKQQGRPDRKSGKQLLPKALLVKFMREFANQMFEDAGGQKLRPVEITEVYERQSRPTQRRIWEEAEHLRELENQAKAFMKAEAYPSITDPRSIVQILSKSKTNHSQYMYAMYEALKRMRWYAFGKPPVEIAERVSEICQEAISHWADGDLSRQDGNVDDSARLLELIVCLVFFHEDYHDKLRETLKSQTHLTVKTTFGVVYQSLLSRVSGSPETSAFNTILTAFIAYLAFRMTKINGKWMQHYEAWNRLGIYGGDDSGTADVDPALLEKAASIMGQVLKCTTIMKGMSGVQFLARRYGPAVWFGDTNSCCDIKRQLSKFHVTPVLAIKPQTKLVEKAFAFSLSDSHTPIIGPFVKKVLSLSPGWTYKNALRIWNSDLDKSVHYPNQYDDWMDDIVETELGERFDSAGFLEETANASSLYDLLSLNCHDSPPPASEGAKPGIFVVDGEIYDTTSSGNSVDTPAGTSTGRFGNRAARRAAFETIKEARAAGKHRRADRSVSSASRSETARGHLQNGKTPKQKRGGRGVKDAPKRSGGTQKSKLSAP